MITVFKDKGKIVKITTQQYSVGLYVAIYTEGNSHPVQFGSTLTEEKYHLELRKKLKGNYLKRESTAIFNEKKRKKTK